MKSIKLTQKNVIEFVKGNFYTCFQINPDGSRGLSYGNVNPLEAFAYIVNQAQLGNRVVLTANTVKLHKDIYPELGVMEASLFSMNDTDFVNKVQKFAVKVPTWDRQ